MEEAEVVSKGANELLNYGALGLFCLFLIIALVLVWRKMSESTKEFTEVMRQHATNEAAQTEVMRDLKQLLMQKLS